MLLKTIRLPEPIGMTQPFPWPTHFSGTANTAFPNYVGPNGAPSNTSNQKISYR